VPNNVVVEVCSKSWMTSAQVWFWIQSIWVPNVIGCNLLFLDQYKLHNTHEVTKMLSECSTTIFGIPADTERKLTKGCAPLAQSMDVSINKSFKAIIHHSWTEWIATTTDRTPAGNLRSLMHQHMIDWISKA
jgi:hypothetical protein